MRKNHCKIENLSIKKEDSIEYIQDYINFSTKLGILPYSMLNHEIKKKCEFIVKNE